MKSANLQSPKMHFLVVDDHALILKGTVSELQDFFTEAAIQTAASVQQTHSYLDGCLPDLILLDLSIPEEPGGHARTEVGLELLKSLMQTYESLNFTILSSYIQRLVTIVGEIENHAGGFTVVDKNFSINETVKRVSWSLQGITHTKDIKGFRTGVELRPEWLQVLKLAFEEGLQDKAIAETMSVSTRTVRLYFTKLQDALGIYPEDCNGQINLRAQTGIAARKMGLID